MRYGKEKAKKGKEGRRKKKKKKKKKKSQGKPKPRSGSQPQPCQARFDCLLFFHGRRAALDTKRANRIHLSPWSFVNSLSFSSKKDVACSDLFS